MSALQSLVDGGHAPGIYRLTSRAKAETFLAGLAAQGWRGFYLDGARVTDKASFLQAAAEALAFPAYFGHNWDAFEECLNDMAWSPAKGYVLLYDNLARFADNATDDWEIARDIFRSAIAGWRGQGVPFYLLVRGTRHYGRGLENL